MSKETEELKEEIRAALQGFSESMRFWVVRIGVKSSSPNQAVKTSKALKLNSKEEEVARKVAKLRKMVLEEDPSADFSKVLEDLQETKEFEMKDLSFEEFKERVENLREKIGSKIGVGKKKRIDKIIDWVIRDFEFELNRELELVKYIDKEFYFPPDLLNDNEFDELIKKIEKMNFTVSSEKSTGSPEYYWMRVYLEKPKPKTKTPQTKPQVVVKEDPIRIASDLENDSWSNFIEKTKPIVREFGWGLCYGDSIIVVSSHFTMHPKLVHKKQTIILSFKGYNDVRGISEERLHFLPKIEKFARKVAEKTGYRIEIHK